MTELKEFKLPDVGEGLTEADIVAWHVKPGDRVEVNQIIVEIETAKAVVELPSPWDGTVARLLAEEGQTVDVGVPIIVVDTSTERAFGSPPASPAPPAPESAPAETGPPERQAVLVGYGVKASATTRRARKGQAGRRGPGRGTGARGAGAGVGRGGHGPGAGQAARPQAGQGPRDQPGGPGRHRARRLHHAG